MNEIKHNKFTALLEDNSDWLRNAKNREENQDWIRASQLISIKILREIRKQGITQIELAGKLNLSPQYINKILKGQEENFTLRTIYKIQDVLKIKLLFIEEPENKGVSESNSNQKYQVIYIKKSEIKYSTKRTKIGFKQSGTANGQLLTTF